MEQTFDEWANSMNGLNDMEISHRIRDKILESPEMDENSKQVFLDTYEFVEKNTNKGKEFKMDLLKTYLRDVKGYNIAKINIIQILALISFCGIQFSVNTQTK